MCVRSTASTLRSALLTRIAAEVDPYQLAHAILAPVQRRDGMIHAHTNWADFVPGRGGMHACTADDIAIRCQRLVFACGYENERHLHDRVASSGSVFVPASGKVSEGGIDAGQILPSTRRTMMISSTKPRPPLGP